MAIISGSYSAAWGHTNPINDNYLPLGNTATGFRETTSMSARTINFDALGEAPADMIFTGVTMFIDFVLQEFDARVIDVFRWRCFTGGTDAVDPIAVPASPDYVPGIGQTKTAGGSLWDRARPLVLTSCIAGVNPYQKIYYKTILAPNYDFDVNYSHTERVLPYRLIVLPVLGGTDILEEPDDPARPVGCTDLAYCHEIPWP